MMVMFYHVVHMRDGKIIMIDTNNILYEDNHIIVVNKESGILSQSNGTNEPDILTLTKKYLKEKYKKTGNVYLGLVHRLDRMVSGVMVLSKTSKAASRLSEQIRNKTFKKEYMCIASGKFNKNYGTLKNYLLKDENKKISYITTEDKGKLAILDYSVINYNKLKDVSLLKIKLHTGRFHQIRCQLANINHPIIGDIKYGNVKYKNRILLHSYKIVFLHPTKKIEMVFTKNLDKDILNYFNFDL